ncbi:N-methyl-L-tryptophan oxidase [Thalassospira sp. TSL5-1]|uniref:N-methyl-L-tryptophan oxidase n=1 Tax=Thalassospira sp. TSL5-1 TaxID=1544451 RepID=UPI00093A293A|nr:N-methyl-L-tryptophan oxidase [Thalassospira sp. TSL5-1]OKH86891.1 amino acid oxidase [Thalassospira sp. TSL5-1]
MSNQYDVAVIGLGAMGSAAISFLAARGVRVIGFEAASPAHGLGSSHGDSRLIRLGYFEDPSYVPLLHRAYDNWRDLENQLRETILNVTGVLQVGQPDSDIITGTLASCELHNLAHEKFNAAETRKRFPVFGLQDDEIAVLDPNGGWLKPEAALWGYLRLAAANGAKLHIGEKVDGLSSGDKGVIISASGQKYHAAKVIVATGAWISQLVPGLQALANPIRQVVAWYRPENGFVTNPIRMPAFLRDDTENGTFFGFPEIGADGVKIGRHAHFMESIDPDKPNPPVNDQDLALLDEFAARCLPGMNGRRVNAVTCRYTMLPGEDFLLDHLPGDDRVIVASPCSGHGFKFTSVIGEILADLATQGGTDLPIDAFTFDRLMKAAKAEKPGMTDPV